MWQSYRQPYYIEGQNDTDDQSIQHGKESKANRSEFEWLGADQLTDQDHSKAEGMNFPVFQILHNATPFLTQYFSGQTVPR